MFQWLWRLVARPSRRCVFRYWDGRRTVNADPLVLLRKMDEFGGEHWHELVQQAGRPYQPNRWAIPMNAEVERKQRAVALQDTADLACKAFALTPLDFDGRGLTEAEQVGVLADYLRYVGRLAAEAVPFVSLPRPASPSAASPIGKSSDSMPSGVA